MNIFNNLRLVLLSTILITQLNYSQDAKSYCYSGWKKIELKDYQGAMEDFIKAIKLNPNYAEAYNNLGSVKSLLGDNNGAMEDFTKAIELDPALSTAYYNRGVVKYELKDYTDAITDFTKAIELNPKSDKAYYNRGLANSDFGNIQGALDDYTKSIELNSKYATAYYNRSGIKYELGDKQGSLDDYTKVLELNPNDSETYNNRGSVKHELGDDAGAIIDFTKAIELNPTYDKAYHNRGYSKGAIGDNQGAVKDFTKAIEFNSKYAKAYCNRGVAKYNLGDKSGACLDWKKAIEFGYQEASNLIDQHCQEEQIGKTNKTVKIGSQIWMIENLNVDHYRNGDKIPEVRDNTEWKNLKTGAWCYYENKSEYGKKYGKLYNWYAVMDPRGLAPDGWHIPILIEFKTFQKAVNDKGNTIKAIEQGIVSGVEASGFSALLAGGRAPNGDFNQLGKITHFWCYSEDGTPYAQVMNLTFLHTYLEFNDYGKANGFSVRCLKD